MYMNSEGLFDDLFRKKLAYPYEKFNPNDFQEPLNLTKEDYWSTLTQSYPCYDDIKRTQELIDKYNITTPQQLTMLYLKMDVFQLTDIFENFVQTSTEEYGINPLYSFSAPRYTWKTGLKLTNIKLDFIKDKHLLLILEKKYVEEFQVSWVIGLLNQAKTNKSCTSTLIIYMDGQ